MLSLLKGRLTLQKKKQTKNQKPKKKNPKKPQQQQQTNKQTKNKEKNLCGRFGGPWHKSVDGSGLHSALG